MLEKCVYAIEYFLDQINGESESYMDDIVMSDNFIRLSGYGWGQQRHNYYEPAHIKGWSYVNTASNYAIRNNIPLKEFLPEYNKYGNAAPLKRNLLIIDYADIVLAFWDGKSRGTKYVIDNCHKRNVKVVVYKSQEI